MLDKPVGSGVIVTDENGAILGLGIDGSTKILPAEAAIAALAKKGISNSESPTTKTFKEGLAALQKENYDTATKLFKEVSDIYPEHPTAPEYAKVSEHKNSLLEKIKRAPCGWFLLLLCALVVVSMVWSVLPFGKKRSR